LIDSLTTEINNTGQDSVSADNFNLGTCGLRVGLKEKLMLFSFTRRLILHKLSTISSPV